MNKNEQIIKAKKIMKRGLEVLVNKHLARKEFTELDQRLLDELSDLSVTFKIDDQDVDILCALQYLYDKDFKGDEDFLPITIEGKKLLDI